MTNDNSMTSPQVSVLVALDDHAAIHKTLAALCSQSYAPSAYEVVFVDGVHVLDWNTQSVDVLQGKPPQLSVSYFKISRGGRAAAWNQAVKASSAPLLLFLADDFTPVRDLIAEHVKVHDQHPEPHAAVLGPAVFPRELAPSAFMRWLEDSGKLFGAPFSISRRAIPDDFFYGANVSLKRSFFTAAGGFDEDFPYHAWDDYELGRRLFAQGMKVFFAPAALAYHDHVITLHERRTAMEHAGESAWVFDSKHRGPHPWHRQILTPPGVRDFAAVWTRFKYLLSGRERDRDLYFKRSLNASFVRGYTRARRRSRSHRPQTSPHEHGVN